MDALEFSIRDHLTKYLAGEASLTDFEDWFIPATWDEGGTDTRRLANAIDLALAEYTSGHWSEEELMGLLAREIEHYSLTTQITTSLSSHISVLRVAPPRPSAAVGTQPLAVSV